MGVFPVWIKHALNMAVQGPHDTDTREHYWAAKRCHHYQRLHGRLPFLDPVLGFRKLGYVIASVLALLPTCAGEFFATKFA